MRAAGLSVRRRLHATGLMVAVLTPILVLPWHPCRYQEWLAKKKADYKAAMAKKRAQDAALELQAQQAVRAHGWARPHPHAHTPRPLPLLTPSALAAPP